LNGLFCSAPASASEKKVSDDARACQICFMEKRAVVFLPCGHLVACVKCAPSLSTCAVCRQPFTATVRAFLSWGRTAVGHFGFAGYVTVCVQLYCVVSLTLHVSAYMAIFKCVGYFYFHIPEGLCFASFFFLCLFLRVVTPCTFPLVVFFIYLVDSCVCVCLLAFSLTHARNSEIKEEIRTEKQMETCKV
jgi:hypothetical protein